MAAHAEELFRFARTLARSDAEAEDLVQDTFLRVIERGAEFRGDSSPSTWLHRVLHNLAVDRARRSAHEVVVEEVEERWRDDAYTVDTRAVAEQAEDRAALEDALVRLPADHRAVLLLHDVQGLTSKEIAARLGISLPAAKQRLRRARMMLVSALASGAERRDALQGVPLRCWDARRWVSDYMDGTLDARRAAALEAHLGGCPTCPPLYAALVGTRARLEGLRDPDSVVPSGLVRRIEEAVATRG